MKRIALCAAALLLGSAASAQQVSPWYGEVGYSWMRIDAAGTNARPGALRGIVGYRIHQYVDLEGMLGFGISDDDKTVTVGGVPRTVTFELNNMYGFYVKPKFRANNFELYGRLGYAHTKAETSATLATPNTGSQSDNDISYGIGANFHFNPKMYVGLDWMRYTSQSGHKVDGMTLGLGFNF